MRRLTVEEREIRSGRGIPLRRWWHFPVLFIALSAASIDTGFLHRCTGWRQILEHGGRGGAIVRMLLTYPCSPYLLTGSKLEWLLFVALYLPLPFAFFNLNWIKRHQAY